MQIVFSLTISYLSFTWIMKVLCEKCIAQIKDEINYPF